MRLIQSPPAPPCRLNDEVLGKDGARYQPHDGVAIEVGQMPNAINTPSFPSVLLRPGEAYQHHAEWHFSQDRKLGN